MTVAVELFVGAGALGLGAPVDGVGTADRLPDGLGAAVPLAEPELLGEGDPAACEPPDLQPVSSIPPSAATSSANPAVRTGRWPVGRCVVAVSRFRFLASTLMSVGRAKVPGGSARIPRIHRAGWIR
ncbi:hypothetical protein Athai_12780 [Actinocatenispora thailandica]|uniref:Uncharacterized protein n=1 Tax=Actinocatenispora thailandica TaxID=227318 RepID=A0A7R7DL85_9ACTN|nr:hypothetical protein Athai_12780 [Actinocatenispora thailandica]